MFKVDGVDISENSCLRCFYSRRSGNLWGMNYTQVIWIIWIKQLHQAAWLYIQGISPPSKYSLYFWIEVAASEHDWSEGSYSSVYDQKSQAAGEREASLRDDSSAKSRSEAPWKLTRALIKQNEITEVFQSSFPSYIIWNKRK